MTKLEGGEATWIRVKEGSGIEWRQDNICWKKSVGFWK